LSLSLILMVDVAPPRGLGALVGGAILVASVGAIVLGISQLARPAISAALVLWVALPILGGALAAIVAYRLYGLATARYLVTRDGIGVRWGQAIEEIPVDQARLQRPTEAQRRQLRPRGALRWPGCVVGVSQVEGLGAVEHFATRGAEATLLVRGGTRTLAISPPDPEGFLSQFVEASRRGALEVIPARSERPDLFPVRLWQDPLARLFLVLGIGLPLVLLGFLGLRVGSLPAQVPFGFDPLGAPDPLAPPGRLLLLPLIGALCWGVDLALGSAFYRKDQDRVLAYAAWALSDVVGLLLWGATLSLLAAV
jgi:hypothetical protein